MRPRLGLREVEVVGVNAPDSTARRAGAAGIMGVQAVEGYR